MKEDKNFFQIIPRPIENLLKKIRRGNEYLDYGRDIVIDMANNHVKANCAGQKQVKILDIGAGSGTDLISTKKRLDIDSHLNAIESYYPNLKKLNEICINAYNIDIEKEKLPFENNQFDIVIANQVIEHTKDIFFIFSEISRVLKFQGTAIIGFPNLAAFHNRLLLLLGEQPVCIRMPGPHVRGITKGGFLQFITLDGYFKVIRVAGSNFFPFPPAISKVLAKVLPSLSISLYFQCQRTDKTGKFIDVLKTRFYETNYFTGI